MNCDLCKHREVCRDHKRLCEDCADMIQRLLIVQKHIESAERAVAVAAAAA